MEPKQIADSIEVLKKWLETRQPEIQNDPIAIKSPDALKSVTDFGDITIDTFEHTLQDAIVYNIEGDTQKVHAWSELTNHLEWIDQFVTKLNEHRLELATIELIRMNREHPITLASYHVDEAINLVKSYASMNFAFGLTHPDTDDTNLAADNMLIENHHSIVDIIRELLMRFSMRCCARLVVKSNQYMSALMSTYLVDLMRQSGADEHEVQCYAHNRRDSIASEHNLTKLVTPSKLSKLSVFAMVFSNTDLYAAVRSIIESYFRELYPNLIILVEEAAYEKFSKYWQHYYSQSLQIGSRLDDKVTVVDTFNDKVYIDLSAIDIRQAHKAPGNAINVLRFRTVNEAVTLINQLRKIPLMTIWNDDIHLVREFAMRVTQSDNFWFNYMPRLHHADRFIKDTYDLYASLVDDDMTTVYNNIVDSYTDMIDELQKKRQAFLKKTTNLRTKLVMRAYVSAISKFKALRNGGSVQDALCQMQLFHKQTAMNVSDESSRVESYRRPVGTLIIYAPQEPTTSKQKSVLFEIIVKNLLIGNAVFLNCFPNTLGAKFSLEYDHVIPFVMATDKLLHMSNFNLDDSSNRRKMPKDFYAITYNLSMSSHQAEAITVALGTKTKTFWSSNIKNSDYWNDTA